MLTWFLKYKNVIPEEYVSSIFDIDYDKLYASGKRIILTDLDNTLISYKEHEPTKELFEWVSRMKEIGFKIVIVSNNSSNQRVSYFSKRLNLHYVYFALKPFGFGFRRAMRKFCKGYQPKDVVEIGDQLLTDVYGSKKMHYYTILVKAIDRKTEKWMTRFNRKREHEILQKVKQKDSISYDLKLKKYEVDNL